MISSNLLVFCILLRAGISYTSAQVAPEACSPINEIEGIQAVLDEAANQKSACVELHGTTVTGCDPPKKLLWIVRSFRVSQGLHPLTMSG